jgi:Bcr/CflA subfamily drug resistance transporter
VLFEITIYLSNDMYLPAMPAIALDLGLSQDQIQSTLTFWFLGSGSLQLLMGPLSDSFGRKPIITLGGALFVISSLVCAVTYDLPTMLLARFVQGSTICFIVLAGYAAIQESFSTKEAIRWLAILGSITILAPALGPLGGAIMVEFISWRYIFWLFVVLGTFSLVSIMFIMPETNINRHPLHLRTISHDFIKIICNKDFMLPCLGYCLLVGIFFFWMFESPFIIIEHMGYSKLFYGLAQTVIFSVFFVGAKVTDWWLNKNTLKSLINTGLAITMVGVLALLLTSIGWNSIYLAIVCMIIISFGSSMLFGPVNRLTIEASKQPMGRRIGVFSTTIGLCGALCGWIITIVDGQNLRILSILVTICAVFAVMLIMQTKIPDTLEDSADYVSH